jgi:hypothetical protein
MTIRGSRRGLTLADIGLSPARAPKYGAQKAEGAQGLKFDSRMEARRHGELLVLERVGQIRNLKCQVRFELVPAVRLSGAKRLSPGIDYVADFTYEEKRGGTWAPVIEDCKGAITAVYRMKRHMMKAMYDLDIRESKPR